MKGERMNKDFNSKEERYNTIRKLCKMDLKHRRRLDRIHDIVKSNQDILRGLEPTFVYESLSIDEMRETILDLFFIPKDNSDEIFQKKNGSVENIMMIYGVRMLRIAPKK